jgi:hypothetical protein
LNLLRLYLMLFLVILWDLFDLEGPLILFDLEGPLILFDLWDPLILWNLLILFDL